LTKDINHTVKAIIHSEDKILLQLRDQKPNIFYPGVWGLFGGGVDDGEKPIDALKRELLEEIGLEIKSAKLLFSWNHDKYNSILHFFLVPLTVELEKLCLNEGQGMDLFSIEQIKRLPITPSLKKNIHKIKQNILSINLE
tara:strand:- start:36 stop:455 length:420 start_codon:yes stop_codon:yes gene_type:complete